MRISPENSSVLHRHSGRVKLTLTAMLFFILTASLRHAAAQADAARENDLLYRVQQASANTVADKNYAFQVSVDGAVVSSNGQPVPGAIVCLLEWGLGDLHDKPGHLPTRRPERTADVLARATTDAQGRYSFSGVKTPGRKDGDFMSWKGYLVAAHPNVGIGWSILEHKKDRVRKETGVAVHLLKFADISGIYAGPDGQPVAGAELSIFTIDETIPAKRVMSPFVGLDLAGSQLMPICVTNEKGEYKFRNLPTGYAALVLAPQDNQYVSSFAAISTDPARQQGNRGDNVMFAQPKELLGTNQTFVASPGRRIRGQVKDEAGAPLNQVLITTSYASTHTDDQGKFELRVPAGLSDMKASNDFSVYGVDVIPSTHTSLLPRTASIVINSQQQMFTMEERDALVDSVEIRLTKGVRVIGKVEDTDGQPIKNVEVEELLQRYAWQPIGDKAAPPTKAPPVPRPRVSVMTGEDGSFEFVLSPEVHALHFSSRSPGLELPEFARFTTDPQERLKLPHVVVDLRDGQTATLKPVRLTRIPPVDVTVLLPDGQPAVGAEVVLWEHPDMQIAAPFFGPSDIGPSEKELSLHILTDDRGKAQMLSIGKPSARATAKATLIREGIVLEGESTLGNGPGKRTAVQLSPVRQGIQIIPGRR